ncbi:MAG TPA: hypothetical protein VFK85_03365 [Anaeromyxobacteraceae bacterium]|nr:hypothetical protein [Anaeromyxobacteraceae bacterium]
MSRISPLHVAPTTERKAEPGRFSAALRGAAAGATHSIAQTLALAAPAIPGGPVLAAAVRGGIASAAAPGTAALPGDGAAAGGGDLLEATRTLQQQAQSFNVQYLQLQENMQRESREFTALSNVMKVRHDTSKAAISNIH